MNEAFLWYLWKYRLFNKALLTTEGETVEVEHPGYQNHDSGPDFFNARIRIGNTRWAGNVEVRVRSSDWYRHEHQYDRAYDNIILHVVLDSDAAIWRPDGQLIPVVELKNGFEPSKWSDYQNLANATGWIPCERQIGAVDEITLQQWLDRVLVIRLEKKTQYISALLTEFKGDWSACFFVLLARNFGFKVNAIPFELLAKSIPVKILSRHKDNLLQLEALLLGQAGFLYDLFNDEYPRKLQKEYHYLKNKLGLQPLEKHLWKFGRLRPGNFPTIRIAQFAKCLQLNAHLMAGIIEAKGLKEIQNMFTLSASEYWNEHYIPDKAADHQVKSLGRSSIDNIIINTVAPFLFIYGKSESKPALMEKALQLLDDCPSETNKIISGWEKIGIRSKTAGQSQSLIELKTTYCIDKKCLTCGIGIKLLNQ